MSAGLKLELDPAEAPVELTLSADGKSGYAVLSPLKKTTPQSEPQWASNIDSEGELSAGSKDKNIEVSPKLRMVGRSEEDFREVQLNLERKLNKMRGEGGTLRLYYPDGAWIDYEVRAVAGGERLFDNAFVANWRTEDEVTFICAPFGRGATYLAAEFSGSDRLLSCEIAEVPGTAPALAEAELVSPGADVWELLWGRESRSYTGASTALALYQAVGLTPLGGAEAGTRTIDGHTGVSVVKRVLDPNWTAHLSTDLLSAEHLTHVGVFEVYAWIDMPTANAGEVGIRFEYGTDDLQDRTILAPTYFPSNHVREGRVVRVTLGQIFLAAREMPQWEGRVLTRSSLAGDELDLLALGLRPLAEGAGRISATPTLSQPAALMTRDEFNQKPAALNGQTIAAAATVTGPNGAGAGADLAGTGGTAVWSNSGSITAPGGSAAEASLGLGSAATTHYLKATNFFSGTPLPSTATIDGIVFEILRKKIGSGPVEDLSVQAVKAGTIQSANRARPYKWGSNYIYVAYGSSTDLFGTSWLYSDINATTMGVVIACQGNGKAAEASVDHVRATVYWTDGEGQKWVTSGDAADLTVEATGHTAQRSEKEDAAYTGRYAVAGTSVASDVVSGISAKHSAITGTATVRHSAMARYIDNNNWLQLCVDAVQEPTLAGFVRLEKRVAGTVRQLGSIAIPDTTEWHQLRLHVDRRGRYFCWVSSVEGGIPRLLLAGQDNDLASGGTLAVGQSGFYDASVNSGTSTRNYDQFVVWIPPLNAAAYEGLGLRLASAVVERQGVNGAWSSITPEGDYLKLAPAGLEERRNHLVFIASPHDPETMAVGFPTELTAAVWVTPRYRGVPDLA